MTGLAWYPRYVGDYARDTKQLSMLEHGAYNLLLDYYYTTGKPLLYKDKHCLSNAQEGLPAMQDHSRLYRLCGAYSKAEQDAVDHVLKNHFELTEEGYVNGRAEETLEKQQLAHAKRVNAGRKGGKKGRKQSLSNAKAKPKQSEPEPEPIKKIYNKKDFLDFWEAYPRQIDLSDAEEAFIDQLNEGEDPEEIINAAKAYAKEQADNEKKYIKSPVTFLDKKVFKSPEYNKPTAKPITLDDKPEWMKKIGENIGPAATISWFSGCELSKGGVLTVESEFKRKWINDNYQNAIKSAGIKKVEVKKS